MDKQSIVTSAAAFAEDYIPAVLVARQAEVVTLRNHLAPMLRRQPVKNLWIHGPPGTGKTCVAKTLLNEFEERHSIKGAYVNCWETETFFSVLDKIIRDFRILGAERVSTVYKMERLENYLQSRPFLLVLDELDKPSPKERDSIIYNLCGIPNVALICICNSRFFYYVLDSRVRSRLDAVLVELKPYSSEDVIEILRHRAEAGLRQDAAREDVLRRVARLADGDARVAIQTLRHAASYADVYAGKRIEAVHIRSGHHIARNAKKKYVLAKLSEHHQLIYGIIRDLGEVQSGQLWQEYLHRCKQVQVQAAAPRTFSFYLRRLEDLNLVVSRRVLGIKGNVRAFNVKPG